MTLKQILFSVFLLFFSTLLYAQEVTSPGFGRGILNITAKDSTFAMNFSGRFQTLYTSQWSKLEDYRGFSSHNSSFMIRRSRLKFNGFAYSPKIRYKMEFGLSNSDMGGATEFTGNAPRYILDAVVMWNFYDNFELWAGQTKLPGNRERIISSGNLQMVDRSLLNSRFNIDRDMGIQLRHFFISGKEFIVREALAVSQGEGRNITTGNLGGYQYTARIEVLPFGHFIKKGAYVESDLAREPSPKLAVAAAFDYNNDAVRIRSNSGNYMFTDEGFHETNITTLFIDAMFKYRGFSFMAEYAEREADEPIAVNSSGTPTGDVVNVGSGLNLQAGYVLKSNWEFSGRYTSVDLDRHITGIDAERQYTLGISKYIVGHKLKLQSDISYIDWNYNDDNNLLFRLQCEIHF